MAEPAWLHRPAEATGRSAEPPPAPRWHARLLRGFWPALGWLNERFERLRSFAVNLALLGGIATALVIVVIELRRDRIIIEPIAVPAALAARGHAPEAVAGDLMNRMLAVHQRADTLKELQPVAQDSELPDIEIPDVGFSLKPFLAYLQALLGREPIRVSGRIIGAPLSGYRIRLALTSSGDPVLLDLEEPAAGGAGRPRPDPVDPLLERAALAILSATDPYVVALHDFGAWSAALQPLDCAAGAPAPGIERLIGAALRNARREDDAWAHNLRGIVHLRRAQAARHGADAACAALHGRELAQARQSFARAIEEDPGFALAYFNRGNAEAPPEASAVQDWQASEAYYRRAAFWYARAITRAPTEAGLYVEWGNAARDTARLLAPAPADDRARTAALARLRQEADRRYRQALSQDPASSAAWFGLGQLAYWQEDHQAAQQAFDQVLRHEARADLVARARFYRICIVREKDEFDDFRSDYRIPRCTFNVGKDCAAINQHDLAEIVAGRAHCAPLLERLTRAGGD